MLTRLHAAIAEIWPWVCALLSHDANALGLTVPRIDLRNGEVLYPSMLLGTGRGAQVYEVMRGGKRMVRVPWLSSASAPCD